MNSKLKLILLLLVFALLLGGAYILYKHYSSQTPPPTQDPGATESQISAPDFTVYDKDGNAVQLSDHFGKPIVLNFWASWCGPCKSEMPAFQAMYETYGDQVQFFMVNMTDGTRETQQTATNFTDAQGYTFPIFFDTTYDAAITYQAHSLPTTYLIGKDGKLLSRWIGAMNEDTLKSGIDLLLN